MIGFSVAVVQTQNKKEVNHTDSVHGGVGWGGEEPILGIVYIKYSEFLLDTPPILFRFYT